MEISLPNLYAQTKNNFGYTVEGTVKNAETKKLLSGVRVEYKEVVSAMTGDQGNFTIKLPSGDVNLVVSCPGYASKVISVKGRKSINIELYTEGFKSVYNYVSVPNGERSPISITNSWSPINESTILSTDITPENLLQGKISGVNLIHRSGTQANGSNVYVRGLNTMNAGIQPLYIVDGIPYENSIYSTSLIGNYFSNPLASIDVKDIQNITVMKDGTSQYGIKGANGVILISTLRPSEMETKINFHAHTGVNFKPVELPVLNAIDQKLLLSDILQSKGMTGSEIMSLPYMNDQKPTLQNWGYDGNTDYYRYNNNTNWQKQIYALTQNQDYYMNVFGGDEVAIYALSVGYLDQKGIVKNTDYKRFNTRFNAQVNLNKKFTLDANMSFLFSSRNLVDEGATPNTNPVFVSLVKSPFMSSKVYDEEGVQSPVVEEYDVFGISNPYALVNTSERTNSQYRFVGNIKGTYTIDEHLNLDAMVGVNFNKEREKIFYPYRGIYFDTLSVGVVENISQHRVDRIFSLYTEASANYSNTFNLYHKLNARVGVRYQNNKAEDDWGSTANTGSDNFKSISYGETLFRVIGGQISNWNWLNFFGTVDYGYKDKYFANYTMSSDASSRYGKDVSKFLLYPSVSGAWLISGEEFMKEANLIDMLKLRLSYGTSGNDDIGNYNGIQYYVPQNILGNYGMVRGNLVDLNLKPEKSNKFNLGIDVSVLNERLNLSLDAYQTVISDMLVKMPSSRYTGFPYYLTNGGTMKNTGLDISLNTRLMNGPFKWDLGIVASTYKNEVTDLKGQEYITTVCNGNILTKVGQSVGVFYGYKTNGVYATQAEANADGLYIENGSTKSYFGAGDIRFVNTNTDNNNKEINKNDMVIIGNPNPDLYGSVSSNMSYKNFDLSLYFTYSLGNDIYNYTRSQLESMSGYYNQTQAVLNRWRVEGDITDIPHAVYGDPMGNSRFSDRWIEDGSYLRLKNVNLSYSLPVKSDVLRGFTVFVTGENLVTLTKYKGLDPEFALGQSTLYNGIDATFTPMARTLSLGVKLEL